jgi:hypothetical protein
LNAAATKCCTKALPAADRTLLRTLLKGSEPELDAFLVIYDALDAAKTALSAQTKAAAEYLKAVPAQIVEGANAPQLLTDATAMHASVMKAGSSLEATAKSYQDHWPDFRTRAWCPRRDAGCGRADR